MAIKKKKNDSIKEVKVDSNKTESEKKTSFESITKITFIVLGIIIVAMAVWAYLVYSSANYNYMGVEFSKAREGKIDFYTAKLPALDNAGNIVSYAKVDFRSSPPSLKNIPVEFKSALKFVKSKTVYVSVTENLSSCNGYSGVALINFGRFLALFGLDAKGAVDDKNYTNNKDTPFVNCGTNPNNTVILIKDGDKTKIEQTAENCYEITFANCEVLRATERFELQMMSEYMGNINSA